MQDLRKARVATAGLGRGLGQNLRGDWKQGQGWVMEDLGQGCSQEFGFILRAMEAFGV